MTIDPREYDLQELGQMASPTGEVAHGRDRPVEELTSSYTAEEVLRARRREELAMLDVNGEAERPYLAELPRSYAGEVTVFEWLDYLINAAGFKATSEVLAYYVEVDWLTEEVREGLRAHMRGFSEVASFDPDGPGPREFGLDDHVLSLIYVARLAALG